ncbi:MAG: hypothetical protein EOP84_05005 [Verrucomicrobiaceae bacterium]|nr:MAG: hypothetical protein EOP84_05005 [Verrucomicrobiaceae bacterium]
MRLLSLIAVLLALCGCASRVPYVSPSGGDTAEVTLLLSGSSSRSPQQPFTFAEGKQCVGLRWIGDADGPTVRPSYTISVKPVTTTISMQSARAELIGSMAVGHSCGGVMSFEPRAGAKYKLAFRDASEKCFVSLTEITATGDLDLTAQLVRRTMPLNTMPGDPEKRKMCSDEYVRARLR